MKKHLLFVFTVFLIAISSCNKEDRFASIPEKGNIDDSPSGHYINIEIRNALSVLRNSEEVDPMKKIEKLLFVFYADNPEKVVYRYACSAKDIVDSNVTLRLKPDDYKLLVVANPIPSVYSLMQKDAPLQAVQTEIKGLTKEFMNKNSENQVETIMMSNDQGLLSVSKSNFYKEEREDTVEPVKVALAPVLARVLVTGAPTVQNGKIRGNGHYVINTLSQSIFLMRRMALLKDGEQEIANDGSKTADRYAYSPGYDKISPDSDIPISSIGDGAKAPWVQILPDKQNITQLHSDYRVYAKETAVNPDAVFRCVTPNVILKIQYIPESLDLKESEGWFKFEGCCYGEEQFKKMILEKNFAEKYPSLSKTVDLIRKENGVDFQKLDKGLDLHGLKFYYRSENYYVIFINHFSYGKPEKNKTYGRYGVIRNNQYILNLKQIQGEGEPVFINLKNDRSSILESVKNKVEIAVQDLGSHEQDLFL